MPQGLRPTDDVAAPLDALLVEASGGTARRFIPGASTVRWLTGLGRHPGATSSRIAELAGELAMVLVGASTITAPRRDRRFTDPAWDKNPYLRRLMQAYLATGRTAEELLGVVELDWSDDRKVRFLITNIVEAMSPSNIPLVNPTSAKVALETGGISLARGLKNFAADMATSPRIPQMVDGSGFKVGENIASTPGAVVHRSEVFELIQYTPQTPEVHQVPVLVVPPTINKFYAVDLAPGRSMIEYLLRHGHQVLVMSWRNPDRRHASWGLPTYVDAVIEALDVAERVTGAEQTLLTATCSGGIIASIALGYLAATGAQDRVAGFTLFVTVLDNDRAGEAAAFGEDRAVRAAAKRSTRHKGYVDGKELAEVFAWLRPGDLIWNYWVNNYLCGNKPPAFDILFWNADTTRMSAQLQADFIDVAGENALTRAAGVTFREIPIDLAQIHVDNYIVAGIKDHITPWENCYRSAHIVGGESRFVLSTSGHIAALVNPPTNAKATYQVNNKLPPEPSEWLRGATTEQGSWWPDWLAWLTDRAGPVKPAPQHLGGGGMSTLAPAPGTYVFDT